MSNNRGNEPPRGPTSLNDLPPGWFGMFEPRPYKNISELLGMLANILITGEKSEDPSFSERYLRLFDTMHRGLELFVDQEFYAKVKGGNPILLEMPHIEVSNKPIKIVRQAEYAPFGEGVPDEPST